VNPSIKQRWITALTSGEYKQSKELLRTDEGFCCLGVLTDLAVKDKVDGIEWYYNNNRLSKHGVSGSTIDPEDSVLPPCVIDWAGTVTDNPNIILEDTSIFKKEGRTIPIAMHFNRDTHGYHMTLACLNDAGVTFAEIAEIIEEQL